MSLQGLLIRSQQQKHSPPPHVQTWAEAEYGTACLDPEGLALGLLLSLLPGTVRKRAAPLQMTKPIQNLMTKVESSQL